MCAGNNEIVAIVTILSLVALVLIGGIFAHLMSKNEKSEYEYEEDR